jgi:hypothetical protein
MKRTPFVLAPLLLAACSGSAPPDQTSCAAGQELFRGACVDPAQRYEPAQRIDHDNVIAFGDPLTQLKLPDPPKSGFRIIAPPRTMMPGEEDEFCLSWPFPSFQNHVVYAARLHTTTGLHHSNLISKPVDPAVGPNPYPGCNKGASDPFNKLPAVIPDVLFANSTQVVGDETLAFPPGKGYRVDPSREIATDIHLLNTTQETQVVEVVYDFFTMPESDLVDEVAPFMLSVQQFDIPPHTTGVVNTACSVFGGKVVEMMPHTHKFATKFTVDFLHEDGTEKRIIDNGAFNAESHITIYDPSLDLTTVNQIAYSCTFDNSTDHDIVWGIGENEMCILFGYVYPVRNQFVGYASEQGMPCQSYEIGLFRP